MKAIDGGNGVPPEPDWSLYSSPREIALARSWWSEIVAAMRSAETLTVANGSAIQRLVNFRVIEDQASRHVAEHGAIFKPAGSTALVGQWNPYWKVWRQADESIRQLEAELALAPTRRHRAGKVKRKATGPRAADTYLKPINPTEPNP